MLEFHSKESSDPALSGLQASEISLAVGHAVGTLSTAAASYIFEFSLTPYCMSALLRCKGRL